MDQQAGTIPVGALLSDGLGFHSAPVITQEVRDIIITQHLKVRFWGDLLMIVAIE
jgi:hypothetical protein